MEPSLTDRLCTHCALCCDGSLFADVELTGAKEATRLEILGLEVEEGEGREALLIQPCRALRGRRCGIYPQRPKCCRTFECQLLLNVRNGKLGVERAEALIAEVLEGIARVNEWVGRIGGGDRSLPLKERCAEALAANTSSNAAAGRVREELEAEMRGVETLIRQQFIGDAS